MILEPVVQFVLNITEKWKSQRYSNFFRFHVNKQLHGGQAEL